MKLRFAFLLCCVWLASALPALAAEPVRFTVTVRYAALRAGPDLTYKSLATVIHNQTFMAIGRTSNNAWLLITAPRIASQAWIKATSGRVLGDLNSLPIKQLVISIPPVPTPIVTVEATRIPPAISQTGPSNPVVAAATDHARTIYQAGLALGNNPRAFSKIGDCQSVAPYFLAAFDTPGQYSLGQYGSLQETIDNFYGSFSRNSLAAMNGLNTAGALSPLWANPQSCEPGESPLACEYRVHRPSIAIISLGTNGAWQSDADYEAGLRKIIEFSIARGVVPILSTKADNVEGGGRFNQVMAKLAAEYDLPLWNFWLGVAPLPNFGIADEYHLSWGRSFFDDPISMSHGWAWRNLTALQSLDSVWKGVK